MGGHRNYMHHASASESDPGLTSSTTQLTRPGTDSSESLSLTPLSSSLAAAEPRAGGSDAGAAACMVLARGPAAAGLQRRSRSMAEVARASAAWRVAKNSELR